VSVELLEQAHFHTLWAMAAYGAPMYAWYKRQKCGCCVLCCSRRCANCLMLRREFAPTRVGQNTGMMSYIPHPFHRDAILRTLKFLKARCPPIMIRSLSPPPSQSGQSAE
jgi:hypothetical protein